MVILILMYMYFMDGPPGGSIHSIRMAIVNVYTAIPHYTSLYTFIVTESELFDSVHCFCRRFYLSLK